MDWKTLVPKFSKWQMEFLGHVVSKESLENFSASRKH